MTKPPPDSDSSELRCPEGKHCRLILVNKQQGLVYCVLLEAGGCPNVLAFAGTRYCRTFLHSAPRAKSSSDAKG